MLTLHGPPGPRRGADLRNLNIIQDGSVLIVDGIIREVGPTRRLDNLSESRRAEEIDAHGRVVLPGFVDSHTHLVSGPARPLDYEMQLAGATPLEITRAGGGMTAVYRAIQDVPLRTLEAQSWRIVLESIRQGTTTIEAKSGYGVNEIGEVKILRTQVALNKHLDNVVSTFMGARFAPADFPVDLDDYVDWMIRHMLPVVRRRELAEFVDVFCEEQLFNVEQTRLVLTRARDLGFGLKLHAGQCGNIGGVKLAVEMGAVSVDHAIFVDDGDISALAGSATIATLLPGPVFFLGTRKFASARTMIDRGVAVALATNYNPESCPTHSMQIVLTLACREMNMTPAEAISAATINGAHALRRGGSVGSIEFGKQADLIMLSVDDYREIPYHFGVNLVDMTMKRGQVVYRASEVKCPRK